MKKSIALLLFACLRNAWSQSSLTTLQPTSPASYIDLNNNFVYLNTDKADVHFGAPLPSTCTYSATGPVQIFIRVSDNSQWYCGSGNVWIQISGGSGGGGAVSSVFGRTGAVLAATGDYTTDQVPEGPSGNALYFTSARGRALFSATSPLTYAPATGTFGLSLSSTGMLDTVGGLGLTPCTTDGLIPKWTAAGGWQCAADQTGSSGSGIISLNGLTASTQTFGVSNDTNVTLSIASSGSNHQLTLGWTGALSKSRQYANTLYSDVSYTDPTWLTLSWTGGRITGIPNFAPSATTDTTNASNITSGTLAAARLPASFNAPTASALAATPSQCPTGQFASGIQTNGAANCATPNAAGGSPGQVQFNYSGQLSGFTVGGDGTLNTTTGALTVTKTNGAAFAASATTDTTNANNITAGTLSAARLPTSAPSLNAGTATALAATPTQCPAGQYPLGVDAHGNALSCTTAGSGNMSALTGAGAPTGACTVGQSWYVQTSNPPVVFYCANAGGTWQTVVSNNANPPAAPSLVGTLSNANFASSGWAWADGSKYVYTTGLGSNSFNVIDVSNASSPALVGQIVNATTLGGAEGLACAGRYCYVSGFSTSRFTVVDVSNPANPTVVSSIQDTTNLNTGEAVYVYGTWAFVLCYAGTGRITAVDISQPTNPVVRSSVTGSNLSSPVSATLVGQRYLYITNRGTTYISVVDALNPAALSYVTSLNINCPVNTQTGITAGSRYVYIACQVSTSGGAAGKIMTLDAMNPASPTLVNTLTLASGQQPWTLAPAGNAYLYADDYDNGNLLVFDIATNPAFPALVASMQMAALVGGDDIKVQGRYAYVTGNTSSKFFVVDLGGTSIPALESANIHASEISATELIQAQSVDALAGIIAGPAGIASQGDVNVAGNLKVNGAIDGVSATTMSYLDATSSIQTQLNATEKSANKGAPNGYAPLNSSSQVPLANLPPLPIFWPCEIVVTGSDSGGYLLSTDGATAVCVNGYGASLAIASVYCWADSGNPVIQVALDGGPSILSSNLTCGSGKANAAAGALNGSPVEGSNTNIALADSLDVSIASLGGAPKELHIVVSRQFGNSTLAAAPSFNPRGGTYNTGQSVVLNSNTSGATICYTTDGSTPAATTPGTCSHGTPYSTPISVAASTTIKAIATAAGYVNSAENDATYTLQVGAIAASPAPGQYSGAQTVTLSVTTTTGATIHYRTDGTAASCSDTAYTSALTVSTTETITAVGCESGYTNSAAFSGTYTISLIRTDNFQRANGSLGANWTSPSGTSGMGALAIVSDAASYTTSGSAGDAVWTADTFTANQSSQITFGAVNTTESYAGVYARHNASTGYLALCWYNAQSSRSECNLYLGTSTTPVASVPQSFATGDTLKIIATGSSPVTVQVLYNGTQIINYSDTTNNATSGAPGFAMYNASGSPWTVTSWTGANQ
jgi:hypothetical protein